MLSAYAFSFIGVVEVEEKKYISAKFMPGTATAPHPSIVLEDSRRNLNRDYERACCY